MRYLLFCALFISLPIAACSSTSDSATCTGTPPVTCDGCCGAKYAADQCLNGAWTCPPLGGACNVCDAGTDAAANDAAGDVATCTGTPPLTCDGCCGAKYAADQCLNGIWTCRPLAAACVICDAGTDAVSDDASGDEATCAGTPPVLCDGCCGSKYAADQCLNGVWTCRPLAVACVICDARIDAAANEASACTGTRPLCFGNNASLCCGNDPSGSAVCSNGTWMCGSAPAPGCNGASCLLEAGPG